MGGVYDFNPEWYDRPPDDPPLWGKERELYIKFKEKWTCLGNVLYEILTGPLTPEEMKSEKVKRLGEDLKGKYWLFARRWNLFALIKRIAFNVPIGPPERIDLEGKDKDFYEDLTRLRIPVLIDTFGFWEILDIPDVIALRWGWIGWILGKIPWGYPDWGLSWLILTDHYTARDWGRFELIYYWLDEIKDQTGLEPFIQTSRIVCNSPDPQDAVAVISRRLPRLIRDLSGQEYIVWLDEDWTWPEWAKWKPRSRLPGERGG